MTSYREAKKLGPGGPRGGLVVFGEGPGVGGGEIRRPRGCKTWKLLQRLFLPELSKHLCA